MTTPVEAFREASAGVAAKPKVVEALADTFANRLNDIGPGRKSKSVSMAESSSSWVDYLIAGVATGVFIAALVTIGESGAPTYQRMV